MQRGTGATSTSLNVLIVARALPERGKDAGGVLVGIGLKRTARENLKI